MSAPTKLARGMKSVINSECLEEVGMGAGAVKNYLAFNIINAVNENPIRFHMTFPFTLVFSMQGVVFVSWKQSLFVLSALVNRPDHLS